MFSLGCWQQCSQTYQKSPACFQQDPSHSQHFDPRQLTLGAGPVTWMPPCQQIAEAAGQAGAVGLAAMELYYWRLVCQQLLPVHCRERAQRRISGCLGLLIQWAFDLQAGSCRWVLVRLLLDELLLSV